MKTKTRSFMVVLFALILAVVFGFAVSMMTACTDPGNGDETEQGGGPEGGGPEGGGPEGGGPEGGGPEGGGSEGGGDEEIDYEPHLHFEEGIEDTYTVAAGVVLSLPAASAEDETDGDITSDIWVRSTRYATITDDVVDGKVTPTFMSKAAGVHTVTYSVENLYGNEDSRSFTVNVTAADPDTENEYGDMSVLAGGGTYVEDFSDFRDDFIKELTGSYLEIEASERSIKGNSLIIDYGSLYEGSAPDNMIRTDGMSSYIKTGTWKVSFKMKVVSGSLNDDFMNAMYIGIRNSQTGTSTDTRLVDAVQGIKASLDTGNVVDVTYDFSLVEIPAGSTYAFHIFVNGLANIENDVVIAYDDMKFEYEKFDVTTLVGTHAETLTNEGLTYNFNDKFTTITNAKPVNVSKIGDETAKTALESSDHFGDVAMEVIAGSDRHVVNGLVPEMFEKGYTYTVTIWYYVSEAQGGSHFILEGGNAGNTTVKSSIFGTQGLNSVTLTFEHTLASNDITYVNLYGNYHAYIGEINVKAEEIVIDESEFVVDSYKEDVTRDQLLAGYTFNGDEGNCISNGAYYKVDKLTDDDMKAAITSQPDHFSSNVWGIKCKGNDGSNFLRGLDGKFSVGDTYTIDIYAYVEAWYGMQMLPMNPQNQQNSGRAFQVTKTALGGNEKLVKISFEFMAVDGDHAICFYPGGTQEQFTEMYIGSVVVKATAAAYIPDTSWSPLKNVDDRFVENFSDHKLGDPTNTGAIKYDKLDGEDALHLTFSGGSLDSNFFTPGGNGADGTDSLLQKGNTYKITFKYQSTHEHDGFRFGYTPNGGGSQFGGAQKIEVTNGEWKTGEITITINQGVDSNPKIFLCIYAPNAPAGTEMWIDDLTIECTAVGA